MEAKLAYFESEEWKVEQFKSKTSDWTITSLLFPMAWKNLQEAMSQK